MTTYVPTVETLALAIYYARNRTRPCIAALWYASGACAFCRAIHRSHAARASHATSCARSFLASA